MDGVASKSYTVIIMLPFVRRTAVSAPAKMSGGTFRAVEPATCNLTAVEGVKEA